MKRFKQNKMTMRIMVAGCIGALVLPLGPLVRAEDLAAPRSPVTVQRAWEAIVEELRLRGLQQDQLPRAEDLELPVAPPARAGARLRVSSVCWGADDERARFRVECSEPGACLPFLVYVQTAARAQAGSCRLDEQRHRSRPSPEPVVQAGEKAKAVLVAAGLRMTAAVTCLERGVRGDVIRVRGHDGRIFRARVAGPALVEAVWQ